jgi:14-3-3 protein epsilon
MASEDLANLSLDGGAEEGFAFEFDDDEEEVMDLRWCVVGRFLCDKSIHVNSMMVRMADLWRPVKGVQIKEAKQGLFLFRFNHPLDMEEVLRNGPWTFDNHLLIMERVQIGVQIENIPLYHADFWVQVHDLPTGLMKETVGTQLANYIGSFVEYDKNNKSSFWRQYMRLRVKIDVRLPLKKDTRVKDRFGNWCTVLFKYEKLGTFCFLCGVLGHAENRCEIRFAMESDDGIRNWNNDLRAEPRRLAGRQSSRWLLEERGGIPNSRGSGGGSTTRAGGEFSEARQNSGAHSMHGPTTVNVQNISIENPITTGHNSHLFPIKTNNDTIITAPKNITSLPQSLSNYSPLTSGPPVNHTSTSQPLPSSSLVFSAQPNNQPHPKRDPTPNSLSSVKPHLPLTPSGHVTLSFNQPIIEPIIIPDPTLLNTPPTSNHKLPPHNSILQISPSPKHNLTRQFNKPNNILHHSHISVHTTDNTNEPEDMEVHLERKRRRDAETKTNPVPNETHQHFLSAGPGSQDCREQ